jgi:superfamily II DNA or RNA helicase
MTDPAELEAAIWSLANGRGTETDLELLRADAQAPRVLDQLIREMERDLVSVRSLPGEEGRLAVADLSETLDSLQDLGADLYGRPRPAPEAPAPRPPDEDAPPEEDVAPEEVVLQASWSAGKLVVWAAARGAAPESYDELSNRLEAVGGPPLGWEPHAPVVLPGDLRADALAIPMKDALGWLVAVAGGHGRSGIGPSVDWVSRVAVEGVRLVALGAIVPTLHTRSRGRGPVVEAHVEWAPALTDDRDIVALTASMPATVAAIDGGEAATTTAKILTAVVDAIVGETVERMELPAAPPSLTSPRDISDAVVTHLDGSPFDAPATLATTTSRSLTQWARGVVGPSRPRLVVQVEAPQPGGVWLLSVRAPAGPGRTRPIDAALRAERPNGPIAGEWARLTRLLPALDRVSARRRGQVALSQDEAWTLMVDTGPALARVGFDVLVPELSRRKATPALRLSTESTGTVVSAHQLTAVAWSVLFDDVELTADEIKLLSRQARPLVQSGRGWVEVDRVDLEQAAAALAERERVDKLTGAEILRHSIGLDGPGLRGGVDVRGHSWAADIVARASSAAVTPITQSEGFRGELRNYQAEALAWLGFLDSVELGGCLALDMGLGKTPTVLAHLARVERTERTERTEGAAASLVVGPAAVVGNWAAEAARFVPDLRVVVHHGASRASATELATAIASADIVITTYATAVRDMDALTAVSWSTVVLDEAQAIKNPASETAQQLRRLTARTRLALTGTPIENGLGDLWAILDFTNPGLVGSRDMFIAQMSGEGEHALRILNGVLLFRRTKSEPEVAAELPDKIDELDHCTMTPEQIGLYQAVLDELVADVGGDELREPKQGAILAAITALKQICNHPAAYRDDGQPLAGRSGKLARLEEIVDAVFAAGERVLVFTHFATWGRRLADHLSSVTGVPIACYDGSLPRAARDRLVTEFQEGTGPGALVLSLKAGGTGLNLTAANHVVLYDRWWNPAVEDQARDRAWRIGQSRTVISHRLICPGTVDERVEEVVAGKRHIAQLVLPRSSSIADLDADQLRIALGLRPDELLTEDAR